MITPDEGMVSRIVAAATAAVLRELGGEPVERADEPEWTPDPVLRRQMRLGRTKYWQISRRPDYPEAIQIGRTKYRNTAKWRAWMAAQTVL